LPIDIDLEFQKALHRSELKSFKQEIKEDADKTFIRICNHIGIDPKMTFTDGIDGIYQLKIIKENGRYSTVQYKVDKKMLLSLLGRNHEVVDKIMVHAKNHRLLKNPDLRIYYGFYYRHSGKLMVNPFADFQKETTAFNRESGIIKVFSPLPEVKSKHNIIPLFIDAICTNPHALLHWLAVYTMEIRNSLKKPFLNLHGEYAYPITALIEAIYPSGMDRSEFKTARTACQYDNINSKAFVYTTGARDHKIMSKMFNRFAGNSKKKILTKDGKEIPFLSGSVYLVMHWLKVLTKKIQYQDSYCCNVYLKSKEEIDKNLEKLGVFDIADFINNQIGVFCVEDLNKYFNNMMNVTTIMSNPHGFEVEEPCRSLSEKQVFSFAKYLVRHIKVNENPYFAHENANYMANKIISLEFIKLHCLIMNIDIYYFLDEMIRLDIINQHLVEVDTPNGVKQAVLFTWDKFNLS
jgi:hypothetical protein